MKLQSYFVAFFALSLAACNHPDETAGNVQLPNEQAAPAGEKNKSPKPEDKQFGFTDTSGVASPPGNNETTTKGSNPDWDKKIIKVADMQLELDDFKKFDVSIHSSLKKFGAYAASEKQAENNYRIENALCIKVPVDQFDALVNSFAGDGIKVMEKNISTEDVTGEVIDTKARLQAKMAVRDKYLQLLKQAKNMDEILQVQNEINNIQENIEAASGRIDYLQHASAYSTVNLTYYQYINGTTGDNQRPDFFTKLTKAFSTGTAVISNLFLFCISIWPLLICGIFVWLYFKRIKLKKA